MARRFRLAYSGKNSWPLCATLPGHWPAVFPSDQAPFSARERLSFRDCKGTGLPGPSAFPPDAPAPRGIPDFPASFSDRYPRSAVWLCILADTLLTAGVRSVHRGLPAGCRTPASGTTRAALPAVHSNSAESYSFPIPTANSSDIPPNRGRIMPLFIISSAAAWRVEKIQEMLQNTPNLIQ